MSTIVDGKEIDIFEMLPPYEGSINIYYGRIGSGKTLAGTRNIISELRDGQVVYANWYVDFKGYDERESLWNLILGFLRIKRTFWYFPPENFHYWNFVDGTIDGMPYQKYFQDYSKFYEFTDVLSKLTDCSVHLDEGHIPFDSYEATKMSEAKRSAVFAMRHFDRSLTVYTQRANSVHVNLRGNTNRFYKCEKILDFTLWFTKRRFQRFQVTEFQDLTSSGGVDETREKDKNGNPTGDYLYAVSKRYYWGSRKVFDLYNTKYLRLDNTRSQPNRAVFTDLTFGDVIESIKNYKKNKNAD